MIERKDHLARTMTEEQGKPLRAATTEVQYAADFLLEAGLRKKQSASTVKPSLPPDRISGSSSCTNPSGSSPQ